LGPVAATDLAQDRAATSYATPTLCWSKPSMDAPHSGLGQYRRGSQQPPGRRPAVAALTVEGEVVPALVELEVAVPHLSPAVR